MGYRSPQKQHDDYQREAQMRAALEEIRDKAATIPNGGAWAAGIATLCLETLTAPAAPSER